MAFDDDVDAARKRFQETRQDPQARLAELKALQLLLPQLEESLTSRRLSFTIDSTSDVVAIEIEHSNGEPLGDIVAEADNFVFETADPVYFKDFQAADAKSFISSLYESLKNGLPRFELDTES